MKVRDKLEVELNDLINSESLFLQVEIMRVKDCKLNDEKTGKQYLAEVEIMDFFDLNKNNIPQKENVKVLSKRVITKTEIVAQPKVEVKVIDEEAGPYRNIITNYNCSISLWF